MFWHPLHATSAVTCLLAMAVGCFANAFKNGTYHCVLTGPLFLIAAILLLSSDFTRIKPALIWTGVLVGTGIAFLLEWRYSRQLSGAAGLPAEFVLVPHLTNSAVIQLLGSD